MLRTVLLGDIATIQTGPFGSQLHQKDYVSIGTPIITVEHLGEDRISRNNLPSITDADKQRLSKYWLEEGDTVFSRVGSVDRASYVHKEEEGWLFSGRCLRVKPDKNKVNPRFLSFLLRSPRFTGYIKSVAVGATMPSINTKILYTSPILLPSRQQQDLTAEILDTIETKIELNRKMNETLEQMGQALFRHYFINNTNSSMWMRRPLSYQFEILSGGTPKTSISSYWDGDIPWFSVVDAPNNSDLFTVHTQKNITRDGLQNSATKLIPRYTTIISARGTVGKLAIAGQEMTMNQSCYALKCNTPFYGYMTISNSITNIKANTHGSVFDTITRDTFEQLKSPVPPNELINEYEKCVQPIFLHILKNVRENHTLTDMRDKLLPKLISGELEI